MVSFSRSYAVYYITLVNVALVNEGERGRARGRTTKRRKRKEKGGFIIDVSLVLVLKIILIVFSANDALVSKITNKRKEINSFRSFNTICVTFSKCRRVLGME